ncbi:MAG: TetR/AcrR family transcriptional regulator [Anaerovoracaceae bacterium]|jgi:AcrR family transcriptional regulator
MKRKTDRRTLYTMSVIKDAFLELIDRMSFEKINVTNICKQAEISRATFYLHYENVEDVLDQVIDDALMFSEEGRGTVIDVVDAIRSGNADELRKDETILPACQRIADSERYHRLFLDPSLSEHIIQRIAAHEKERVVPEFMERSRVTEEEAEMLFRFILHGSFAVNQRLGWNKDNCWYQYQSLLARFINGGIHAL